MTKNKETVTAYMDGFGRMDRELILSCLADDVEWIIPGMFHTVGKEAFAGHIVDEGFSRETAPKITVDRLIEEDDKVVAEGSVVAPKDDGTFLNIVFCDVFDMHAGKIKKLVSYLVEVRSSGAGG